MITVITITVYFPRYIAPANFAEKENNPKIKAAKVAKSDNNLYLCSMIRKIRTYGGYFEFTGCFSSLMKDK